MACSNCLDRSYSSFTEGGVLPELRQAPWSERGGARHPYDIAVLPIALEAAMTTNTPPCAPVVALPFVRREAGLGVDLAERVRGVRRCQRRRNGKREHRDVERDGQCGWDSIRVH